MSRGDRGKQGFDRRTPIRLLHQRYLIDRKPGQVRANQSNENDGSLGVRMRNHLKQPFFETRRIFSLPFPDEIGQGLDVAGAEAILCEGFGRNPVVFPIVTDPDFFLLKIGRCILCGKAAAENPDTSQNGKNHQHEASDFSRIQLLAILRKSQGKTITQAE